MLKREVTFVVVLAAWLAVAAPVLAQTAVLQGLVRTTGLPDIDNMPLEPPPGAMMPPPASGFHGQALTPQMAPVVGSSRPVTRVRTEDRRTYFQRHPKVRATVIGAGVGAAGGAVVGLISHRGIFRGAAIGAAAGAGTGLIRSSTTLRRHPVLRDVATGTAVGVGLGWAASRRGGNIAKAGALGALGGLGWSFLKNKL